MPYQLTAHGNILEVIFSGGVEQQDLEAYFARAQPFIDRATEPQSVHFLIDVLKLDKISAGARKYLFEQFRNLDVRVGKTAVVGGGRYVRVLGEWIIPAFTGNRERVRFFDTREQALAWLEEK